MAFAGVEGAISGDAGDLLIGWNLVEQFGQHRRVAHFAGCELGRPDFQRLLVNSNVDLAPDAAFGAAVLAGIPLPFAFDLDPRAVRCPAVAACGDERGSTGAAGLLIHDTGC